MCQLSMLEWENLNQLLPVKESLQLQQAETSQQQKH